MLPHFMFEDKINIDIKEKDIFTLSHLDCIEEIEKLIDEDENIIHKKDIHSNSFILELLHRQHYYLYYKLLEKFDINYKNSGGLTLLMKAVLHNKYKVVEDLIVKGADLHIKSNKGYKAFHYASEYGLTKIIKTIVKYDINIIDDKSKNLCYNYAIKYNYWNAYYYIVNELRIKKLNYLKK